MTGIAITLGHHQYGKAEIRVVRVYRDGPWHELVDYNVSVVLGGDFSAVHLHGDNTTCLTTDAMKNTVHAYAKHHADAARQPESFALALATHFVDDIPQVTRASVSIDKYEWERLEHGTSPHPHAFRRSGTFVRTTRVTYRDGHSWVVSGIKDLVLLKTTASEFFDFYQDPYTTLAPTHDRIMATAVAAQWWHMTVPGDWQASFEAVLAAVTEAFADHHSLALQHTLFAMGTRVLETSPGIGEIRLSLPNKHHFVIDLTAFGLDNPNEVFNADDRPYGLIEGTVRRDDAPSPAPAFDPGQGW